MSSDSGPQCEAVSIDPLREDAEPTQRSVCGQNTFRRLQDHRAFSYTAWQKHRTNCTNRMKQIISQGSGLEGWY